MFGVYTAALIAALIAALYQRLELATWRFGVLAFADT